MPDIQMRFDLRVPPFADTDHGRQYQAALEMVDWGERIGVEGIGVSEHHGDPAGFMSAPVTVATAILSRTKRVRVTVSALLVPLHDPVRLAEQLATIECMTPGRLAVIVGAGYRKVEFAMAGVDRSTRGKLVEEFVSVCRQAWTGEPFEWRGRTVLATPKPPNGGPTLFLGGKTELAARRAARLRLFFSPASGDAALANAYRDECAVQGYQEGKVVGLGDRPMRPGFVMLAKDPDAVWEQIKAYAMYDAETYASWQDDGVRSDWVVPDLASPDDLRTSGRYLVVTPEECREMVKRDDGINLHPLMGGIDPELAWDSLRLFEAEVLPSMR